MSDLAAIAIAAIAIVPGVLGSILTAYLSWHTLKLSRDTNAVARKTEENTNHLKDELVAEVRKASFAKGEKSEREKTSGSATE